MVSGLKHRWLLCVGMLLAAAGLRAMHNAPWGGSLRDGVPCDLGAPWNFHTRLQLLRDAQTVLGVLLRDCLSREVVRAHWRAALREHPDKGGQTCRMQVVNGARDVLEHELRRRGQWDDMYELYCGRTRLQSEAMPGGDARQLRDWLAHGVSMDAELQEGTRCW